MIIKSVSLVNFYFEKPLYPILKQGQNQVDAIYECTFQLSKNMIIHCFRRYFTTWYDAMAAFRTDVWLWRVDILA